MTIYAIAAVMGFTPSEIEQMTIKQFLHLWSVFVEVRQ